MSSPYLGLMLAFIVGVLTIATANGLVVYPLAMGTYFVSLGMSHELIWLLDGLLGLHKLR